jgi:hypothetical protein
MTSKPNFTGARLKVKRADKHILDIEEWFRSYEALNPHEFRIEIDPKTGKGTGHVKVIGPAINYPPGALSCIIGDAAHNLRAALDHVASAILIANDIDPETATFPLDKNRESLVSQPRYREIERVSPKLAQTIVDFICTGDAANMLVGLNHLDRADKHRLLITSAAVAEGSIICIANENLPVDQYGPNTVLVMPNGFPPPIGSPAHAHNERNRNVSRTICFGKGEPFEDQPVVPTLFQMAQLVSALINELDTASK